jgi:hypothetical protein
MRSHRVFAIIAAAAVSAAAGAQAAPVKTTLTVRVDSAHHRIVLTAGPFDLAKSKPMPGMAHDMMHMTETPMMRFEWPVDGWLHGVDVKLTHANGDTLPIRILHHMPMFNFDRRSLVHTMVERLFSWGQDTQTILLPAGVSVPLPRGDHLGFLVAWHNDTDADIHDAYLHLTLTYELPAAVKVAVIPFYADVYNIYGKTNSYDLPAGKSTRTFNFQLPISGRLIAVGGHMHQYGLYVSLVDSATGKTLVKLNTVRNKQTGAISATGRFVFGFHEDALRLKAHHTYTVESVYDNLSGKEIPEGAMGLIGGAFEPDDLAALPKVDLTNPLTVADLKSFPPDLGEEGADSAAAHMHDHMDMDMPMPKDSAGVKPPLR